MNRKFFKIGLSIIAISLLAFFFKFIYNQKTKKESEITMTLSDYIINSFVAELPEINARLPYKIDPQTTLLSVEYSDFKITTRYELNDITKNYLITNENKLKIKNCKNDTKNKLLEANVEFIDKYQNKNSEPIFEIITKILTTRKTIELKKTKIKSH